MSIFRFYLRKRPQSLQKILCKMRLTLVMLFVFGFSAVASSQKVVLDVQNATLNVALNQLKNQTGVRLLFDESKAAQVSWRKSLVPTAGW